MHNCSTLADQSHGSLQFNSQMLLTVWSGCFLFICPLKAWRPVSVICPTHSSGSLFCIWTAVWIKPLSEECAVEWKSRYGGLVWRVVQHLTYGGGSGAVVGGQLVQDSSHLTSVATAGDG